ncbi:MAG: thiamine diphosphokinase [Firmicutes bacterium]|nr:thiamine diphosphokinase [Bacillota bacterium]
MDSYPWKGKTVLIVADGEPVSQQKLRELSQKSDVVIGVDGGTRQAYAAGLPVHLLLGDLDSIDPDLLRYLTEQETPIAKFPPEKDATDTELALDLAKSWGARRVYLVSGVGSRLDHSLANLLLLTRFARYFDSLVLETALATVYYLSEAHSRFSFDLALGRPFSLLALTPEAAGISISGAKYLLNNATLTFGSTLGVSNEGLGGEVEVSLESGVCALIVPGGSEDDG